MSKAFDYVPLDNILNKIKENQNFALLQPIGLDENGVCGVKCILVHKSGHVFETNTYPFAVKEDAKLQDEGADESAIVLITVGESDLGPYERRAMEACIRLCGREEGCYISPFVHIREKTRARFAVVSIGRAQDRLADMLYCFGAPRLRVQP